MYRTRIIDQTSFDAKPPFFHHFCVLGCFKQASRWAMVLGLDRLIESKIRSIIASQGASSKVDVSGSSILIEDVHFDEAVIDDAKADPGWPNAHPVTRGGENTYLQMFLAVAKIAARHGLMVMMACHRLDKDSWPGTCRCRCMPHGDHMVIL